MGLTGLVGGQLNFWNDGFLPVKSLDCGPYVVIAQPDTVIMPHLEWPFCLNHGL